MARKYYNAAPPCEQAAYFADMAEFREYWFQFSTGDLSERELDELELWVIDRMGGYSGGEFWMIVYGHGKDIFGTDLDLLIEKMESDCCQLISA